MIIKKPYAFLIKNFRVIHAILFALLLFITIKSTTIYMFFSDYATNHYYINSASLGETINVYMYISCVLIFLVSLLVYYLLSIKKKEDKIYLFICLYIIVLFMFYIFMSSVFKGLLETSIAVETVRVYRDISFIMMLPLIAFTFIMFGRALGFNIKQFDFKKDLEDIKIDEKDAEEVEVTLGSDNHKVSRFFRKTFRLIKYFILENKLFVISLSCIAVFIITLSILSEINVYDVNYIKNEEFIANSIFYQIEDSYYTNTDMNNVEIEKGKYYIIVKFKASNKTTVNKTISKDNFRLNVGEDFLLPISSLIEDFIDIGQGLTQKDLMSGDTDEYIVIFEVSKNDLKKDYILSIKNFDSKYAGNSNESYKEALIEPKSLIESVDEGTYNIPADIKFNNTVLKNSSFHVSSYQIADSFKEKYNSCIDDKCKVSTYSVIPTSTNKKELTILKLKATVTLDEELYINRYIVYPKDLIKYYGYVKYVYGGKTYTSKINPLNVNIDKLNYIYAEVPIKVKNAKSIDLIILIRGRKFTINLK